MQFPTTELPRARAASPLRPTRVLAAVAALFGLVALAQAQAVVPGDLLVSTATYVDPNFSVGAALPISTGATAIASSAFCTTANCSGNVWNNDSVDANFGITAAIALQSLNSTTGAIDSSLNVTALAAAQGINLVTSFSSKSELAINLTPDGTGLTFMGYDTGIGQLDISNSNSLVGSEPGNTDIAPATSRTIGQLTLSTGSVETTTTGSYSGNNGRAAILGTNGEYYTVGNAGNGSGSASVTAGTGVQAWTPGTDAPTSTSQVGMYTSTAKANNFRGETIFDNTLYVTKGSGSKGVDTVYQVGTAGTLPTGPSAPITILPGFNTQPASSAMTPHPFGIWFANATTLYVADEGSGAVTDFGSNPTTQAGGLQKYSFANGTWTLDYELTGSLIGSSYTVAGTGTLAGDSLTTFTDGLRNLTGQVNANGTVTLYAVTSTAGSVLGDAGADPNKVVSITDNLSFTSATQAAGEDYQTLETAQLGQVLRGVALAPVTAVPEPGTCALMLAGLGTIGVVVRRRKARAASA